MIPRDVPSRASRSAVVLVLAAAIAACRPASAPSEPVVPSLVAGVSPPFVARQKVVATHAGVRRAFDAVLQFDGVALVLLGMTPMGTKAFAVVQRGDGVEVTPYVDMPLPAPPRAILRDIHAAYFDPPRRVEADGWHRRRTAGGDPLDERWAEGRLQERVHGRRRDARASRLRFPEGLAPGEIPREVTLDHPALDLQLEIHTVELTRADGPAGDTSGAARH
jgi:hypothetical protein